MSNGEIAKELAAKRSVEIKASLMNADWKDCKVEGMKDVLIYLVDGMDALINRQTPTQSQDMTIKQFLMKFALHSPWAAVAGFGLFLVGKLHGII